jgi:hypothetical protein
MWITIFNNLIPQIKNLLNSKLFLYCVIGGLVYFWYIGDQKKNEKIDRLSSNQIALTEQFSRQLQLTSQDFQRIYHKEDSIAKIVGIKPNQIQQVIVNNYHYKDSTNTYIPYVDTTKRDTLKFIAPLKCMKVEGYVVKSGVVFTKEEFNDKLHTFLYKKYDHKFLFFKWGKYIDAKVYSECKHDTIAVEKNIKIINN